MEPGLTLKYGVVPFHPSSWGHGLSSQLGGFSAHSPAGISPSVVQHPSGGGASGRGLGDSSVPAPHPLPLPLLHCPLGFHLDVE